MAPAPIIYWLDAISHVVFFIAGVTFVVLAFILTVFFLWLAIVVLIAGFKSRQASKIVVGIILFLIFGTIGCLIFMAMLYGFKHLVISSFEYLISIIS